MAKLGVRPRWIYFKAQALSHLRSVWGLYDQWVWTSNPPGSFPERNYTPGAGTACCRDYELAIWRHCTSLAKWAPGADGGASLQGELSRGVGKARPCWSPAPHTDPSVSRPVESPSVGLFLQPPVGFLDSGMGGHLKVSIRSQPPKPYWPCLACPGPWAYQSLWMGLSMRLFSH